jgi:hypothetical protein
MWTNIADNQIITHHSRFEFDLNRPPEKAIYLLPSDAWDLQLWKTRPPTKILVKYWKYMRMYIRKSMKG